jgi:hypothetical protein
MAPSYLTSLAPTSYAISGRCPSESKRNFPSGR